MAWPPVGPTTTQNVIPSYLYVQYNDDDHLQAFVAAFNNYAQAYINWFNATPLAIYTSPVISGALLDWVATNLYGYPRPALPTSGSPSKGPFNTYMINELPINGYKPAVGQTFFSTSDDVYKRCLTWNFYKGDGFQFSIKWLKRRVMRFLNGLNGTDPGIDNTYPVSVVTTSGDAVTISLATSPIATILQQAIKGAVINLPLPFVYTVTLH